MKKNTKLAVSAGTGITILCCLAVPFVIAGLAGIGLSFLINDFILFPLLFAFIGSGAHAIWKENNRSWRTQRMLHYVLAATVMVIFLFVPKYQFVAYIGLIDMLFVLWNKTCCFLPMNKKTVSRCCIAALSLCIAFALYLLLISS